MRKLALILPFVVAIYAYKYGFIRGKADINDAVMAKSYNATTMEPKEQAESFRAGDAMYLCVQGWALEKGKSVVTVRWMLGGSILAETSRTADRDGKYWMVFTAPPDKVTGGNCRAEVAVDGSVKSVVAFRVNARQ